MASLECGTGLRVWPKLVLMLHSWEGLLGRLACLSKAARHGCQGLPSAVLRSPIVGLIRFGSFFIAFRQVYTFGNGDHGKLGHGDVRKVSVPTLVAGLVNMHVIKVG